MLKEKLESLLNEEYKLLWTIKIDDVKEEVIEIDKINYIRDIINNAEPNPSNENIIVSKTCSGQINLIDWYHRLKHKIYNGEHKVQCYVLDWYKIERYDDELFKFFERLKWSEIEFIWDLKLRVNESIYLIEENEWCWWCSSGWSSFELKEWIMNKKILVDTVTRENVDEDLYDLVINGELIAHVDQWYWNGYYWGDFEVYLIS